MTQLQNLTANSGAITQIGENFDATSPAGMYGRRAPAVVGLTWAYYGGRGFGNTIADGTVALTASTTNYVVASRSTGAVSTSTSITNWNDTTNYYRLYLIVTGSATITTATDYREFTGGAAAGGGMTNPMTTPGDIIYGGSSGTPLRLGVGTNGYVLTLAAGVPTWAASSGGGFSNPMTFSGDLILGGSSGTPGRLGIGSNGQVLTVTAGAVGWAAASSGFANPMTTPGDLIVGGASGTAGRLAAGTATFVLTSNGAGVAPTWQAAAGGGGGLTNFAESLNTTSPNTTIPAVRLIAVNAATNVDFVIAPKGTGAIMTAIPDSSSTGGIKRGSGAVDFSNVRGSSLDVASGSYSFLLGGQQTRATGTNSGALGGINNQATNSNAVVVGGSGNTAAGAGSVVLGGDTNSTGSGNYNGSIGGNNNACSGGGALTLGGNTNLADANASVAWGIRSATRGMIGAVARSGAAPGSFTQGDRQSRSNTLQYNSSGTTTGAMTVDGGAASATNQFNLPTNMVLSVRGQVTVRNQSGGDGGSFTVHGACKSVSGTVSLCGTPVIGAYMGDTSLSACTVAIVADNTNKCLRINVTGIAASSLSWVAELTTAEAV